MSSTHFPSEIELGKYFSTKSKPSRKVFSSGWCFSSQFWVKENLRSSSWHQECTDIYSPHIWCLHSFFLLSSHSVVLSWAILPWREEHLLRWNCTCKQELTSKSSCAKGLVYTCFHSRLSWKSRAPHALHLKGKGKSPTSSRPVPHQLLPEQAFCVFDWAFAINLYKWFLGWVSVMHELTGPFPCRCVLSRDWSIKAVISYCQIRNQKCH